MDEYWEIERLKLYELRRDYPHWTQKRIADQLGHCVGWVKKWLRRFREAKEPSLEMFKSQSRVPHTRHREIVDTVRHAVLDFRDQLKDIYGRVVGAKTILYHLHKDEALKKRGVYVPKAASTIHKILREGGRIPTRVREHFPLERPEPMSEWEMDFGQIADDFEFLTVMDRGTSIMVNVQSYSHFNAETALMAVAKFLLLNGLPKKLRFDNDPRYVGNWLTDGFPSPLMRFLWCVGVEPDLVEPGKPYHKPFAERSVRTIKHEFLYNARPEDWIVGNDDLLIYQQFYNHDRANQSSACGNRPPYEAFPELPVLPHLPDEVDPDAWVQHYHRKVFKRKTDRSGRISVGKHHYSLGYKYAKKKVGVWLDAKQMMLHFMIASEVVKSDEIQGIVGHKMPWNDYFNMMLEQVRTENQ